ncbi:MAG: hypothetical protein K2O24_00675 [Muribaculaceae bacterium]|nr:hypothetical protein [Muribaculaceae bacterium]
MRNFYFFAMTSALLATSSVAFAADIAPGDEVYDGPVKITISPATSERLEEFPETFTMTFTGPDRIKKNLTVANPVMVFEPGSDSGLQCTAIWDNTNNSVTLTTNKETRRTLPGIYTVRLRPEGVQYIMPGGSTVKSSEQEFFYDVIGQEEQVSNVKYDILMSGTTPGLANGLNIRNKTLETLQLVFNASCLQPLDDAAVTITGPNYKHTVHISYNMGTAANTSTWMKAPFPADPEYNGTYTLTIPEGVLGDEAWIKDPEKGRANAAVHLEFEVTGGKQWSEDVPRTMLNPIALSPNAGADVYVMSHLELTFDEDVYCDEDVQLKVGIKTDPSALEFTNTGYAKVICEGKTARLDFVPPLYGKGEYMLSIPKGTFRNTPEASDATDLNSTLYYNFQKRTPSGVKTSSVNPTYNSRLDGFAKGEGFSMVATPTDLVASMSIFMTEIPGNIIDKDEEIAATVLILDTVTTSKNEAGDICWTNEGDDIVFKEGYKYNIRCYIYDPDGNPVAQNSMTYYGPEDSVGVESMKTEEMHRVYNMQGMRLGNDINALPAGLYIIDGKKVMLRK